MATYFYCFEEMPKTFPKQYTILPQDVIGQEPAYENEKEIEYVTEFQKKPVYEVDTYEDEDGNLVELTGINGEPVLKIGIDGNPIPKLDESGIVILEDDLESEKIHVLDEFGNKIPLLDEDGKTVISLDENGLPIEKLDENGDTIPLLDENGERVPQLDENGDTVFVDVLGGVIRINTPYPFSDWEECKVTPTTPRQIYG